MSERLEGIRRDIERRIYTYCTGEDVREVLLRLVGEMEHMSSKLPPDAPKSGDCSRQQSCCAPPCPGWGQVIFQRLGDECAVPYAFSFASCKVYT